MNQDIITKLQNDAENLLNHLQLSINGCVIEPKEIEVYYFKTNEFEDTSVHRNDLQRNNLYHFYVHPAGLDFVVSDSENYYHSYLIRSALVNNNMIVGPIKVRDKIFEHTDCTYKNREKLENMQIDITEKANYYSVLFSERIGLGENAAEYCNCHLRAVLCDIYFKVSKYKNKEKLMLNYLQNSDCSLEEKMDYARIKLGYIPKSLREL